MMDDSFFRGIMGPFGSGKSTVCIMDILRRASLQKPGKDKIRRSRWAVIRNTYPESRTTTIKSWHQWVGPELGRWMKGHGFTGGRCETASNSICTWLTGRSHN
jgi:hypothetical protein